MIEWRLMIERQKALSSMLEELEVAYRLKIQYYCFMDHYFISKFSHF